MTDHGNPADRPGYDAAGEEWFASGAPEARFETASSPRPAATGIRWFVGIVLGIIALGVVGLVVAMITTIGR